MGAFAIINKNCSIPVSLINPGRQSESCSKLFKDLNDDIMHVLLALMGKIDRYPP